MKVRTCLLMTLLAVCVVSVLADKKNKKVLPESVLRAQTVCVVIQAGAREPMSDPNANLKAQREVEKAIMKWGRFQLAPDVETADLVIAVQKGTGKAAEGTVGGGPVDNVPVIGERTDTETETTIRVGARQGTPSPPTQYPEPQTQRPSEGAQLGGSDDRMTVYQGGTKYPLDGAPIWNSSGKDVLRAPDVKAVEEFRKAVAEAEKAAQQKQQPQQQKGQQQPNNGPSPASKPPSN